MTEQGLCAKIKAIVLQDAATVREKTRESHQTMYSRRTLRSLMLSLLLICLAGCGSDTLPEFLFPRPAPTVTIEARAIPTRSPEPTIAPSPSRTAKPTELPSPSPVPVPFPPRPEEFADYPTVIIDYLNDSQGDADGLREMLKDWQALRDVADLLRVDVDDDGKGELLLLIVDASGEYVVNLAGDLLVIDIEGQKCSLAYRATSDLLIMDPALLEVDDVNRDGYTELAFTSTSCGAHTCFTTVHILTSGLGTYSDLTHGDIDMPYAEIYFDDWDGDGVPELVLHGGTFGSIGAGPQRARTVVYQWDGVGYTLAQTMFDSSNYLYFKVVDANQALLDGDYQRAVALYREAIENPNLEIWIEETEREELIAFARYRLSFTYLLLDEVASAQSAQDELLTEQPENIYAQVMTVLWDAYLVDGDLTAACEAVGSFAALHPETADVLADYGYTNPTFTPEDVCPMTLF